MCLTSIVRQKIYIKLPIDGRYKQAIHTPFTVMVYDSIEASIVSISSIQTSAPLKELFEIVSRLLFIAIYLQENVGQYIV